MSDTMITPEERRLLRSGGYGDYERLRLLNALEQAEARAKENSDALTAAYMSGKYDGRKEAEANMARLTKMVDWLANQLDCPSEFTNCAVDCAECRKEAARRAVAAGEEPCQK